MAVGGRVLLPAVRAASEGTFIIADGFSCREQIAQATHRRALHLAELIRLAYEPPGTDPAVAERRYVPDYGGASLTSAAAWAAAAMIGAGALLILRRNPGAERAAPGT